MLLEMRHIGKTYGSVQANRDVSLGLHEGEVLALVGENGAGKSTIMKILYGLERPTEGEILLNGAPVSFKSPTDAMARGIGMVQQHFMLFDTMTVAENIVYGREVKKQGIFFDRKKTEETVRALSERYKLDIDPRAVVGSYPVGLQQRVEILKILYQDADIIIFDEPSAVLTPLEVRELLATIRHLADSGKSIILITHKLQEVMDVADRVVVMRAGQVVGERQKSDTTVEEMSFLMVGRQIPPQEIPAPERRGRLLEVEHLSLTAGKKKVLNDVNLHVDGGEIVGIAGVSGNGQSQLVACIFGLTKATEGSVRLAGKEVLGKPVKTIRQSGMALIPEDRYLTGSATEGTLRENVLIGQEDAPAYSRHGLLDWRKVEAHTKELIATYDVKASSTRQKMGELSGGNAQKLIVARELSYDTPLLIADEPTRGVDIGAIEFIHDQLLKKRSDGGGVLLISSELSEILSLCDRIYVIHDGAINGEFERGNVDDMELGLLMVGGKRNEG